MELTTEQAQALNAMLGWFGKKRRIDAEVSSALCYSTFKVEASRGRRENYRLSGYAGTGKSYLVGKFLQSIGKEPSVYCLAPSHKARRNLQGLIEGNGVDWIECQTIAKFLGQSPKINPETGFEEFTSDDKGRIYADLVIADEYSMLSTKNLADIQQKYSGRILFVGDPAQLPPVGEKISPVRGLTMSESQLITPVRYSGEIGAVSASYRSPNPQEWKSIDSQDGTIVKSTQTAWFAELVANTQAGLKSGNYDECKAIVFKNKTAETWNNRIRQKLWGDNVRPYEIGDRLIARKPLFRKTEEYRRNKYCHFSRPPAKVRSRCTIDRKLTNRK